MRAKLVSTAILGCLVCAWVCFLGGEVRAEPASLKLEAHLIWGTNDEKSPDPSHKPVDAEIKQKLKDLPLKWANYFEVNRKSFVVFPGEPKKVPMSQKCEIEVKNLGRANVEVSLFGKGTHVFKQTQALPKGELLVLGGRAPNSTSWLVVVKRLE
jgi:hypothetical protein